MNDAQRDNDDLTIILARAARRKRRVAPPAQRAASTAQPTRSIIMIYGGDNHHDTDAGADVGNDYGCDEDDADAFARGCQKFQEKGKQSRICV